MLPESWIDALFSRFEGLYGTQFIQKWDGLDVKNIKQVWAETLDGINGEVIGKALAECAKTCKYPPSAPEFYMICKQQHIEPCHVPLLSKPIVKQADGYERIQKIKQDLAAKMTGGMK